MQHWFSIHLLLLVAGCSGARAQYAEASSASEASPREMTAEERRTDALYLEQDTKGALSRVSLRRETITIGRNHIDSASPGLLAEPAPVSVPADARAVPVVPYAGYYGSWNGGPAWPPALDPPTPSPPPTDEASAVPSYGSSFPFKTHPADPWK